MSDIKLLLKIDESIITRHSKFSLPIHATVSIANGEDFISFPRKSIYEAQDLEDDSIDRQMDGIIWQLSKYDLLKIVPNFNKGCFCLKVVLQDGFIPELNVCDDKAIQTPSYLDTHTNFEALSVDFVKLLEGSTTHNVEITCGERVFKAHKDVLNVRSPVFSAMLHIDMAEGRTGRVKIDDMEADILKYFLLYLYCEKLPQLTMDVAKRLYQVSDKYAVEKLKEHCGSFLVENVGPEDACEVLLMACDYNDPVLRESAIVRIMADKLPYRKDLWKDFCDSHPRLANEVLNRFLELLR